MECPQPRCHHRQPNRLTCTPEQARTRTLSDAEWKRLAAALDADQPLWRDLFTMSLLTLQRMGAVCSMRWADLSLETNAAWLIPAEHMKGRRSGHIVPLAALPEALRILRARRAMVPLDCEFVFPAAKAMATLPSTIKHGLASSAEPAYGMKTGFAAHARMTYGEPAGRG
jgi:integrase